MSLTIREALRWAKDQLELEVIEDALFDAEILLAHALKKNRVYLHAYGEQEVTEPQMVIFRELINRRALGEPVAYITGVREFMSLEFKVDSRVLIPRPETELLVEMAIEDAKTNLREAGRLTLVDVGTGSGAIAVSGASLLPASHFYATDLSKDALEVAQENARRHNVAGQITFLQGSLLEPLEGLDLHERVDFILANLPYIPEGNIPGLQREVRMYEPSLALGSGPDGLDLYRELIPQAACFLRARGKMFMEIDFTQGRAMSELLTASGNWTNISVIKDYAGKDRIVVCTKF